MPWLAPSISPGTSATTSCLPSGASTVPRTGASVVNGYSATFGFAFEMRRISDDLPGVRQADERGVGKQLEPQLENGVFAREPDLGEPRRLARRRGEALVPAPARSASGYQNAGARARQVGDELLVVVEDLRPRRDPELDVVPSGAVLVVALARATPPAFELLAAAERREIAESRIADEHDVATRPAVAAVRAPFGHELLAAEAEPAVAPTPGLHFDAGPVLKHGATSRCWARRRPSGARRSTGTRPCRPAWRRSCRRDRCRRPVPGGSGCRAGERGSSPP